MAHNINAREDGIGHFISDNILMVPSYQRPYSWKVPQAVQLFEDLTTAFEARKEYFLGSIVLIDSEEDRLNIVDGQQRLATTALLIAAIRNYFRDNDAASGRHTDTETTYLFKRDMHTRAVSPKLVLSDSENAFFQEVIEGNDPQISTRSEQNIADALKAATQHIEKIASPIAPTERVGRLVDFLEFIAEKVEVIVVSTNDDANAFTIFETLNDRGLVLSVADLVKNYLFKLSGPRLSEAKANWHIMTGIFDSSDDEEQLISYIAQYWNSKYSYCTRPQIFNEIKKKISSQQQAIDFIKELTHYAGDYTAMHNPQSPQWQALGAQSQEDIETLVRLRLEQHKPLLLAILRKFGPRNQSKMLSSIVNWSVRLMVTGGNRSGSVSANISRISIEIENGTLKSSADVTKSMKKIIPDDKQFSDAFATLKVSRSYPSIYLLTRLERVARLKAKKSEELDVSESIAKVNLEHILPKAANLNDWDFTDEQYQQSLNRLGNQAVLSSKENSKIGSEGFEKKKEAYKTSSLLTTSTVATMATWNQNAIDNRQLEMSKMAIKAWPL